MNSKARKHPPGIEDPGKVSYANGSEISVQFAAFISFFDRFGTPPILFMLATSTGLTVTEVVKIFSIYLLFYALGQPLWGVVSDRFGRLIILRTAILGALLGGIGCMFVTSFIPLMVARAWTGFMVGALYPTLLTLIGDFAEGNQRVRLLSRLQVIGNLGTAFATLIAGSLAALTDWRLVFGLTSLGCLLLLLVLRDKRESPRNEQGRAMLQAFRPAVLGVYGLVLLEGMALLGTFTYIVPALELTGVSVTVAGVLGASYAVGILCGAQIMRKIARYFCRTRLITIGGGVLLLGLVVSALSHSPFALTVTATLLGVSTAILHVSLQGWATEVAPAARATTVSFFSCSMFLGTSLATFLTSRLADSGDFRVIFSLALPVAAILTIAATWGHSRWIANQKEPGMEAPKTT